MRTTILILMTALFIQGFAKARPEIRPADAVPTGILYDLAIPLSGINYYDGTKNAAANTSAGACHPAKISATAIG